MGGTGWDEFLTENILGVSFDSAKAAARAKLAGKDLEKEEVAIVLEENGTIDQSHVEQAYRKTRDRRKGIVDVFIAIVDSQGKKDVFRIKTLHGEVQIPVDLIEGEEVLLQKGD